MTSRNDFAYTIDYDKELAEDQRNIDQCDRMIALELHTDALPAELHDHDLAQLCIAHEPSATALGVKLAERIAMAMWCWEAWEDSPLLDMERPADCGKLAKATFARIESLWDWERLMSLADVKSLRKQAIASRGRHRRNKAKFGR